MNNDNIAKELVELAKLLTAGDSKERTAGRANIKVSRTPGRSMDYPDELSGEVQQVLSEEKAMINKMLKRIKKIFNDMAYVIDDDITVSVQVMEEDFQPKTPYGTEVSATIMVIAKMKGIRRAFQTGFMILIDATLPYGIRPDGEFWFRDKMEVHGPHYNFAHMRGSKFNADRMLFYKEPTVDIMRKSLINNKNLYNKVKGDEEALERYREIGGRI